MVWKATDDGTLIYSGVPFQHPDRPPNKSHIVPKNPSVLIIKENRPGFCEVTLVSQLDIGGSVPIWLTNLWIQKNLGLTFKIQQHFLQQLGKGEEGGKDISAGDAKTLGLHFMALVAQKKKKTEAEVVADFVQGYSAVKELKEKYEWIEGLLVEVARMRFKKTGNTVNDPLVRLSHKKARVIGRNFAHALRQRKTAAAGVDQWRLKYPAIRGLMEKEPWFEVGLCELGC